MAAGGPPATTPDLKGAPMTPVVLLAEELSPATLEALGEGVEIRHVDGTDRDRKSVV